jgi:hypothetical protein
VNKLHSPLFPTGDHQFRGIDYAKARSEISRAGGRRVQPIVSDALRLPGSIKLQLQQLNFFDELSASC